MAIKFEHVLLEEFRLLPVYLVTPKDPYDLDALTSYPENLFPKGLSKLIGNNVKYDIEQVARCIAFEVPTGAFHLTRILESVLRVYWDVVTQNAPPPKSRAMGAYLGELNKNGKADANILAVLMQIKDLYRNPIAHPEVNLSIEQAMDLYSIIKTAVTMMLIFIQKNQHKSGKSKAKRSPSKKLKP